MTPKNRNTFLRVDDWKKNPNLAHEDFSKVFHAVWEFIVALSPSIDELTRAQNSAVEECLLHHDGPQALSTITKLLRTPMPTLFPMPDNVEPGDRIRIMSYRFSRCINQLKTSIYAVELASKITRKESFLFANPFELEHREKFKALAEDVFSLRDTFEIAQDCLRGFPFDCGSLTSLADTLERLSSPEIIQILDITAVSLHHAQCGRESLRLATWLSIEHGASYAMDQILKLEQERTMREEEKFSRYHQRGEWWKAFRNAGYGGSSTCRKELQDWINNGVAECYASKSEKGPIRFLRSFLNTHGIVEPEK